MTIQNSQDLGLSNYSYDALIFDRDGTLVNSAPIHYQSFDKALKDYGSSLNEAWYLERTGLSSKEILTEHANENKTPFANIIELMKKKEFYYLELISLVKEIIETSEIVRSLHNKIPMAVASSGNRDSVIKSLESVGLLEYFDHIITAEDVIEHKPSPDIFLVTAERLGVSPDRCVVFEDSFEGIEAATIAGSMVIDVKQHASIYKP